MMNHVSNYKLTYLSMMDVFSVLMLMIFDNFYNFYKFMMYKHRIFIVTTLMIGKKKNT